MNDNEITQMLHHLKENHYTYRLITKRCKFAKTKIANYLTPGGKSVNRCGFTEEEKQRLVLFYLEACKLVEDQPKALAGESKIR